MEKKFKVGDKIKAIQDTEYVITTKENEWEGIVTSVSEESFDAKTTHVKKLGSIGDVYSDLDYDYFEISKFTIDNLKFGDILTLRNGEKFVYASGHMFGEDDSSWRDCDVVRDCYENNLLSEDHDEREYDIVKVERLGNIVFTQPETVKEMTVSEISKALGYEVKVVKE